MEKDAELAAAAPQRSLGAKLVLTAVVATVLALAAAIVIQSLVQYSLQKSANEARLRSLSGILAANSAQAVSFDDSALGTKLLASLRNEKDLEQILLFTTRGEVVASFSPSGHIEGEGTLGLRDEWLAAAFRAGQTSLRFYGLQRAEVVAPIRENGEVVGNVYIAASLQPLRHSLRTLLAVLLGSSMLALTVAWLAAERMQRRVMVPVNDLLGLTIDVTRRGDYGLRARAHTEDEIGALVHGFNAMLSQIAERDRELQRHRESLEELVVERTRNLERANDRLSQLLQQTAENRQSIEAANSAKTEFLTRINQELRTLTTGLATSMDLMSSMARGSRARPFAEIAQSCADGLLRVLNDTFESLRNNNANVQLESNDFDLRRALIETVQIYAWRAQEKGLELLLDIDTRLDSYVRGDALRVRHVLMNLLSNAVKFTTRGLVLVRVRQLQRGTDVIRVSFEISDTGIGIRAENRSTTFASVVTGAGARSQVGPAVGLLVTRELVELMQGKISVESEFGRGSNFELELQFKTSLQSASDIEPALVPGRRIFLIDDSQACRELLQNQLTQAGLEVTQAADGVAAQRLLEVARRDQRLPAVIVIDAAMPQLDGVETLRRMRDDPTLPRIPAVLLCPLDFEFDDELQRELTPAVAIRKPVQLSQLSIAMTEVLTPSTMSTPGILTTTSVTSDAPALSDTAEMAGTVTHIAEHFVSEVAAALAELDAALERQDAPAATLALDLLTVASERLGLPALSSACDAANKNVAKGQLAAAKRVRPALEELRRRAIDRFKRYLTGAVA